MNSRDEKFKKALTHYGKKNVNIDSYREKFDRYHDQLEKLKSDPDYVILDEGDNRYSWAHVKSVEGKAFLKKLADKEKIIETHKELMSNITVHVADELSDNDTVTKIEIRQNLDKYGKFSVENMKSVIELLTVEGIEVK